MLIYRYRFLLCHHDFTVIIWWCQSLSLYYYNIYIYSIICIYIYTHCITCSRIYTSGQRKGIGQLPTDVQLVHDKSKIAKQSKVGDVMMEPSRELTRTVQSETRQECQQYEQNLLKFEAKNWAAPSKLRDHFVTNNKYHPSDTLQQTKTCEKTNGFPKNILNKWCFVHACVSHLSENLPGGTSFHLQEINL